MTRLKCTVTAILGLMIVAPLNGKQKYAQSHQYCAQNIVETASFIQSNPPTEVQQRGTANETEHISFDWLWEPVRSNWPLIVIGFFGVLAANRTLRRLSDQIFEMQQQRNVMDRQLDQMKSQVTEMGKQTALIGSSVTVAGESAAAAKQSAEAAKSSADAILNSERAWMEIDLGPPDKMLMSDPNDPEREIDDFGFYSVRIKNQGRTVARIESCQVGHAVFLGEFKRSLFSTVEQNFNTLLGTSDSWMVIRNINVPDMFLNWSLVQEGNVTALILVGVRYRDVIDSQILRESSAVFRWDTREEQPERLTVYNVYS